MKHTQGPWKWVNSHNDEAWDGNDAATLVTVERFGEDKTEVINGKTYTRFALPKYIASYVENMSVADAQLIAAAPDLLEALMLVSVDKDGDGFISNENMDIVRAAIAKAERKDDYEH